MNDSERYDEYSSPLNKSINQDKLIKTRNKFNKNIYTNPNTNLEESFNIKQIESNTDNSYNGYKDKNLFLGRLKFSKKRNNNLSFNNSLNNSEVNFINYKRTINPGENEEIINEEMGLRYSCYNPNISNLQIRKIPNRNKAFNIGENYINVKKIININNNISRNIINVRQPENKIIYGRSSNNFKNRGK